MLDYEKPQLISISLRLKKRYHETRKRIADARLARRTLKMVGGRLSAWVESGGHRMTYDSIDEILEELGLTSDELCFFCSKTFNKNFLTWRKDLRIEEAKQTLLDYPDLPAYKVGHMVGIKDKSNFRHQFKAATGMTPGQWREKYSAKKSK
jgi:AraC-like DNA-binding protein